MIEIPLTQGYVAFVDDCDGDLADLKWGVEIKPQANSVYVKRNVFINGCQEREVLHRVILSRILDRPLLQNEHVDHENRNGLDNQRENLRLATRSQNMGNMQKHNDNRSGYKGVDWNKKRNKWRARIQVNGKTIHLGRFDTPEEAHEAYCIAAKKYFGEFARFK